ncbi:hypothetical protein CPT_Musica_016 [Burkholderia phage Musica]|uniref:Uncharacterized protein n=1 Tax=Burkholderia phage Musica TaxID=2924903 RepID=A0AAE9K7E6_9CAUD|nr:hypothetical protein CPT_Musica_016 [Burkholderia phage Musica]
MAPERPGALIHVIAFEVGIDRLRVAVDVLLARCARSCGQVQAARCVRGIGEHQVDGLIRQCARQCECIDTMKLVEHWGNVGRGRGVGNVNRHGSEAA